MMSSSSIDPFGGSEPLTETGNGGVPPTGQPEGEAGAAGRVISRVRANLLLLVTIVGFSAGLATVVFSENLAVELFSYLVGVLLPITTLALYRRQAERVAASRGRTISRAQHIATTLLMVLGLALSIALAAGIAGHFG